MALYLTLLHYEAPPLVGLLQRGLVPSARIVSPSIARPRFRWDCRRVLTGLHQTSSIDMIRLIVACIHHDTHDSTVKCFTSFNCASMRHPLHRRGPNPTSFLTRSHDLSLLRNCSVASNSAVPVLRLLLICCEQASQMQSAVSHFRHG